MLKLLAISKSIWSVVIKFYIFRLQKLRKERSAKAARDRRTKENVEYDKVKDLLPIDAGKSHNFSTST